MIVLGIADNHDASAALVQDGELLAAAAQERFDRRKNSHAFPWAAIESCLDQAGVRARDVHRVVLGSSFTPSYLLRSAPWITGSGRRQEDTFSLQLHSYVLYQVAIRRAGMHRAEVRRCLRWAERELRRHQLGGELQALDHHQAHAEAAWRTQSRSPCLVFTLDAMGDGLSATVSMGEEGRLSRIWSQSGLCAANCFYSRVTQVLGFTPNRHEGKITGLAAYGEPPEELLAALRAYLHCVGPGFNQHPGWRPARIDDDLFGSLAQWSREEVASATQQVLEEAVCSWVSWWIRRTGVRDLALCGGTFANVKLNQRIAELDAVSSVWVYPNMGDGGLAVGAALWGADAIPGRLRDVYHGPSFTPNQIAREISIAGMSRSEPADLTEVAAEALAQGKVVARFDGGMEFGPRALGNRSLLARPDDPSINDWLNEKLDRTEFMPFAPVVLAEDADEFFEGYEKATESARFMTICFRCRERFRELAPGVVHVDGTARPQILHREDNPGYHALLSAFKQKTGIPALVNTSFNMHEEPIVCSPFDALRAWKRGRLDAMIAGPYWLTR